MKLKILMTILAAIIAVVAYLFVSRSNPVVYRYVDRASVQYSAFIVQNPFRDREPERKAEVVLQRLKSGHCDQALSLPALEPARIAYLCEREQKYQLASWSLMDRKGEGQKIQLIYDLYRNSGGGNSLAVPAWIDMEKKDGEWRAASYETAY